MTAVEGKLVKEARLEVYDSSAVKIPLISDLRELIRYRYLIRNLISRDLKVRYKRSSIGFVWVMLNPLLTMAVMSVVFSHVFGSRTSGISNYPVYILGGLLIWNVFAQGTTAAMGNLMGNSGVLRRMYVPPSAFVASTIGSAVVNLSFALIPFIVLSVILGARPSLAWFYVIVPMVQVTIFSFGVGLIISALVVFFQDIYEIYNVFILLFMYLTPVFYPVSVLGEFEQYEYFNPMFHMIEGFRNPILSGQIPSLDNILITSIMVLLTALIGWLIFTRLEGKFVYHL